MKTMNDFEREKLRKELEASIKHKEQSIKRREHELWKALSKCVEISNDLQDAKIISLKQDLGIGLSNKDYELLDKYDE
ncbi:hypothetical protein J0X14_12055 [Muricauda sp. CAU 1633]|uniref:hypothetical protein n=1 Tax=Allomuricauda sp. CAU 1633 TaxID=2816036 RepID=UPI001A8E3838|nr:hypothetical protein [Muricauda sp. CAU 1633]MBO0323032.1 hypothetical protein [Muricauda sp. CAU 1633]